MYFGGPGRRRGRLRDLLEERIQAVPAGGAIDWVTYYFRDRRLAAALLSARKRGVEVRVTLEGCPRTSGANDAVAWMLDGPDGLGDGFRLVRRRRLPRLRGERWRPHLHEKIYCFSHPQPCALVGSFNPSGDEPELDPDTIREIGDQDAGYNLLVQMESPVLVEGLTAHVRQLHRGYHGPLESLDLRVTRSLHGSGTDIHFWPRMQRDPISRLLAGLAGDARVRIAASHIKGPDVACDLLSLARRGARVALLGEGTRRRIPDRMERRLREAGIDFRRVGRPGTVAMHDKFMLAEWRGRRRVVFGSLNWTSRSRWLNREVAVISSEPSLFDAFADRWEELCAAESGARGGAVA